MNYNDSSLLSMFKLISLIAQSIESELNTPEILQHLFPLMDKYWQQIPDSDRRLLPLFEVFELVVYAIKEDLVKYEQFVKNIFVRCVQLLKTISEDNIDFFIRAIDLVSALLNSIGSQAEALMVMEPKFVQVLIKFMQMDQDLCIRQYVFALVGDM